MTSIGIIANPASGKDIRRLVSYATTIDNNEKVNICKRIVLAAQGMGVDEVVFMPDTFMIGMAVLDSLESDGVLKIKLSLLDFEIEATMDDTVRAARMMEERGVGSLVVLGGDGTSRAAAKSITTTPLMSISTGTNNVYPAMMEGTVAGMAAAAAALMGESARDCCIRDKKISVYVNGELRDIALIDAVVSDDFYAGAKAIWDPERIRRIAVTRCHPASIGFSAVAGAYEIVRDWEDAGLAVTLGSEGRGVLAPIAAGVLTPVHIAEARRLALGEEYGFTAEERCMIALDGEREVRVQPGDAVTMVINRDGPWRIVPRDILSRAMELGMYNVT